MKIRNLARVYFYLHPEVFGFIEDKGIDKNTIFDKVILNNIEEFDCTKKIFIDLDAEFVQKYMNRLARFMMEYVDDYYNLLKD